MITKQWEKTKKKKKISRYEFGNKISLGEKKIKGFF